MYFLKLYHKDDLQLAQVIKIARWKKSKGNNYLKNTEKSRLIKAGEI